MKTLLVLALLLFPAVAPAGSANCWTIQDPDQRAYCRASERKSAGDCSFITDYALRQTCRARTTGNASVCNTAGSQWEREQCKREAEKR